MMKLTPLMTSLMIGLSALAATDVTAQDRPTHCGATPSNPPVVPDGSKATTDAILNARKSVLAYTDAVDAYIKCMESRARFIAPYMSKEQLTRYDEDMADLNNGLRELQISLNKAIRAYRAKKSK